MQDLRFDELSWESAQEALEWMGSAVNLEVSSLEIDYTNCGFIFKYIEDQTRFNDEGFPYLESIKLNLHTIVALLIQWEPEVQQWNKLMTYLTVDDTVKRQIESYVFGLSSADIYGDDFSLDLYTIDQFQIPIHIASLQGDENILYLLGFLDEEFDFESLNWKGEALLGGCKNTIAIIEFIDWFINKALNRYYELLREKISHSWEDYFARRKELTSFSHCYALAESHLYRVDEEDDSIIDFFPLNELKIESIN